MRTEQLAYFLEIANQHSITAASEKLHISQQTLSSSLKALEKELNIDLLERSFKGVILTEAGEAFYSVAKNMLFLLEQFQKKHQPEKATLHGILNIYTMPAHETITNELLPYFYKKHPQLQIFLNEASLSDIYSIFSNTNSRENHVALIYVPSIPEVSLSDPTLQPPKGLHFVALSTEKYLVCTSPNSPLAKYKNIPIKTLLKYPLISHHSGHSDTTLLKMLTPYGTPNIVFSANSSISALQAVSNDCGVTLIPSGLLQNMLLKNTLDNLKIIPLKEKLTTTFGYLISEKEQDSPIVHAFTQFLCEYFS